VALATGEPRPSTASEKAKRYRPPHPLRRAI